jgi:hypothetical protein
MKYNMLLINKLFLKLIKSEVYLEFNSRIVFEKKVGPIFGGLNF